MSKILIVEDNQLNSKLMKDILSSQGYEIKTEFDGQKGLDKAEAQDFDLILLDIQMPVVSGYDFLERFKKDTPVLVVSACAMGLEIKKAQDLGCAGYISKPIKINEFLESVKKILGAKA